MSLKIEDKRCIYYYHQKQCSQTHRHTNMQKYINMMDGYPITPNRISTSENTRFHLESILCWKGQSVLEIRDGSEKTKYDHCWFYSQRISKAQPDLILYRWNPNTEHDCWAWTADNTIVMFQWTVQCYCQFLFNWPIFPESLQIWSRLPKINFQESLKMWLFGPDDLLAKSITLTHWRVYK